MVTSMSAIQGCVTVAVDAVLVVSTVHRRRWNGTKNCGLSGCMHSVPVNLSVNLHTWTVPAINNDKFGSEVRSKLSAGMLLSNDWTGEKTSTVELSLAYA
jgi:hypothetical protein